MKKLLAALLSLSLAAGCSRIPDKPASTEETGETTPIDDYEDPVIFEERDPQSFEITQEEALIKLNAEGGSFDGIVRSEGEYDGTGYVVLDEGMRILHIASISASQHYRVMIAAHSYGDAAVSLSTGEGVVGTYYLPASETMEFSLYAVDNLYLPEGQSFLTLEAKKGTVSIDYILLENTTAVSDDCYRTAVSVVGKNTNIHTISTMKYMSDNYGSRILTAQNVTVGTNAEIDAVQKETGRYPAMRCGNLMYSSAYADESKKQTAEDEINLALDWGKNGGIISFFWHWFSPQKYGSDIYKAETGFKLSEAVTNRDIATASAEEIEGLLENGMISESCALIVEDIDKISEALMNFCDERLTVVWQPIPYGDSDIYWWGGDAESYKWLWELMFRRMDEYHKLNNLIWVWNGTNPEFYPGDKFCDIYGQSLFENSSASYAARFAAVARTSDTDTKPVALTSCDTLMNVDYLKRDNAMWLWLAPSDGKYVIDESGALSEQYTSWQRLSDVYNSRICITLDELPDMNTYGIEYMDDTDEGSVEIVEN